MFAQYSEIKSTTRENKSLLLVQKYADLFLSKNKTFITEELEKKKTTLIDIQSVLNPTEGAEKKKKEEM